MIRVLHAAPLCHHIFQALLHVVTPSTASTGLYDVSLELGLWPPNGNRGKMFVAYAFLLMIPICVASEVMHGAMNKSQIGPAILRRAADSCGVDQFWSGARCVACMVDCPVGFVMTRECTDSADATCARSCGVDQFWSGAKCVECMVDCPVGFVMTRECTDSADTTCARCAGLPEGASWVTSGPCSWLCDPGFEEVQLQRNGTAAANASISGAEATANISQCARCPSSFPCPAGLYSTLDCGYNMTRMELQVNVPNLRAACIEKCQNSSMRFSREVGGAMPCECAGGQIQSVCAKQITVSRTDKSDCNANGMMYNTAFASFQKLSHQSLENGVYAGPLDFDACRESCANDSVCSCFSTASETAAERQCWISRAPCKLTASSTSDHQVAVLVRDSCLQCPENSAWSEDEKTCVCPVGKTLNFAAIDGLYCDNCHEHPEYIGYSLGMPEYSHWINSGSVIHGVFCDWECDDYDDGGLYLPEKKHRTDPTEFVPGCKPITRVIIIKYVSLSIFAFMLLFSWVLTVYHCVMFPCDERVQCQGEETVICGTPLPLFLPLFLKRGHQGSCSSCSCILSTFGQDNLVTGCTGNHKNIWIVHCRLIFIHLVAIASFSTHTRLEYVIEGSWSEGEIEAWSKYPGGNNNSQRTMITVLLYVGEFMCILFQAIFIEVRVLSRYCCACVEQHCPGLNLECKSKGCLRKKLQDRYSELAGGTTSIDAFANVSPPRTLSYGDNSVLVEPGRPVEWPSPTVAVDPGQDQDLIRFCLAAQVQLPEGLQLNSQTGVISGTCHQAGSAQEVTILAWNPAGVCHCTVQCGPERYPKNLSYGSDWMEYHDPLRRDRVKEKFPNQGWRSCRGCGMELNRNSTRWQCISRKCITRTFCDECHAGFLCLNRNFGDSDHKFVKFYGTPHWVPDTENAGCWAFQVMVRQTVYIAPDYNVDCGYPRLEFRLVDSELPGGLELDAQTGVIKGVLGSPLKRHETVICLGETRTTRLTFVSIEDDATGDPETCSAPLPERRLAYDDATADPETCSAPLPECRIASTSRVQARSGAAARTEAELEEITLALAEPGEADQVPQPEDVKSLAKSPTSNPTTASGRSTATHNLSSSRTGFSDSSHQRASEEQQLPERHQSLRPSLEGYEIGGKIAEGGQGHVWKATRKIDETAVVVKFSFHRRIENEVENLKTLENLEHPNVVRFVDYSEDEHAIVMEYVDGRSLKDEMTPEYGSGGTKFVRSKINWIMQGLLSGLSELHRNGISHRDVKPDNIMLRPSTPGKLDRHRVVLVDFGLSKAVQMDQTITKTVHGLIGTLQYCSPEQVDGKSSKTVLDCRVDVWAVGVTLYEMLSGKKPFGIKSKEPDVFKLAGKITHRDMWAVADAKKNENSFLRVALAKRREHRFSNAIEMLEVYELILNDTSSATARLQAMECATTEISCAKEGQQSQEVEYGPKSGALEQASGASRWKVVFFACMVGTGIDPSREASTQKDEFDKERPRFNFDSYPRPEIHHFTKELRYICEALAGGSLDQIYRLILHFSGHADAAGLYWYNQAGKRVKEHSVTGRQLAGLIAEKDKTAGGKLLAFIDLAFLNACSTLPAGLLLHRLGVRVVVCWAAPVPDGRAREFVERFYREVRAQPGDYSSAFTTACAEMGEKLRDSKPCLLQQPDGTVVMWDGKESVDLPRDMMKEEADVEGGEGLRKDGWAVRDEGIHQGQGDALQDDDEEDEDEGEMKNWRPPKSHLDFAAKAGECEKNALKELGFNLMLGAREIGSARPAGNAGAGPKYGQEPSAHGIDHKGMLTQDALNVLGVSGFSQLWRKNGRVAQKAASLLSGSPTLENKRKVERASKHLEDCVGYRQMDLLVFRAKGNQKWSDEQFEVERKRVLAKGMKHAVEMWRAGARDPSACKSHGYQLELRWGALQEIEKLLQSGKPPPSESLES